MLRNRYNLCPRLLFSYSKWNKSSMQPFVYVFEKQLQNLLKQSDQRYTVSKNTKPSQELAFLVTLFVTADFNITTFFLKKSAFNRVPCFILN